MAVQTIKSGLTLKNDKGGTITYNITLDDQTSEWKISATEYVQADGTQLSIPANSDIFRKDKFANQSVQEFFEIDNDQLVELEQALMTEVTEAYNSGNSAALPNYQSPNWATPQSINPDGTSTLYQTPFTNPENSTNTPVSPQTSNQSNPGSLIQAIEDFLPDELSDFASGVSQAFNAKANLGTIGANGNYSSGVSTNDTLIYPLALGELQSQIDTCVIEQFSYISPNAEEFLTQKTNTVLKNGLKLDGEREGRYKNVEGMVILPMPQSFEEKRGVQFGEDTMNTLAAGLTQNVIQDQKGYLGMAGGGALVGGALGMGGGIGLGGISGGARTGIAIKALSDVGTALVNNNNASGEALLSSVMSSNILKAAGVNVSAETILARGAGVVPNPNMELLFRSPLLRNFGLVYRMTARSEAEATMIRRIIRFFKQGMSPRTQKSSQNYFLKTPNVFGVTFKTSNEENISMPKFKTCALRGFTTDYAPDKMWAAYDGGQPVSVTIVLEFGELTPIYSSDYDGLADDVIGY